MANRGAPIIFLLLLLLSLVLQAQGGTQLKQSSRRPSASPEEEYVPVKSVVYGPSSSVLPAAAVLYEPFKLCKGCRCCSPSNASRCVDTSCCYGIDCDLPGKPFGTCAFIPRTCGCDTGNCTQPS